MSECVISADSKALLWCRNETVSGLVSTHRTSFIATGGRLGNVVAPGNYSSACASRRANSVDCRSFIRISGHALQHHICPIFFAVGSVARGKATALAISACTLSS